MKIVTVYDQLGRGSVARVGGEEDRKGNKVVIRDLEGGFCEISRQTSSSKDDVKYIACFVSGKGLERVRSKEGKGIHSQLYN
jgi:hypothetical protein